MRKKNHLPWRRTTATRKKETTMCVKDNLEPAEGEPRSSRRRMMKQSMNERRSTVEEVKGRSAGKEWHFVRNWDWKEQGEIFPPRVSHNKLFLLSQVTSEHLLGSLKIQCPNASLFIYLTKPLSLATSLTV